MGRFGWDGPGLGDTAIDLGQNRSIDEVVAGGAIEVLQPYAEPPTITSQTADFQDNRPERLIPTQGCGAVPATVLRSMGAMSVESG